MANNILVHEIGKETKIVVMEGKDVKPDDFFSAQYHNALSIAESIVRNQANYDPKTGQVENFNNIISFIGDRGSGKTSCMLTFANILEAQGCNDSFQDPTLQTDQLSKCGFYLLPTIDPSFFAKEYNIIGSFIASIYNKFQYLTSCNRNNSDEGIIQDFYNALANAQRSFGKTFTEGKDGIDDMERLEQMSSTMRLKSEIKTLVDRFLCYVNSNSNKKFTKLVLCIDDIDLNTETAVDMMEWIRKYLIQPNILILFAIKLDQLSTLKKLELYKEYDALVQKNKISDTEIDLMTEKYFAKMIPLSHHVYMPEEKTLSSCIYQYENGIIKSTKKELRNAIVEEIFNKTKFLFYNSLVKTNYIVPRNLREALHLMSMLVNMDDLPEKPYDYSEDGETYLAIWTKALKSNQTLFKKYLFEDCLMNNLSSESRELIQELLSVEDSSLFNAAVLRVLKKKFKLEQYRSLADTLLRKIKLEILEINRILREINIAHNISMGDALWIMNWIDRMDCTFEERYFLFVIRTMYSIRMYEYYDEMFNRQWKNDLESIKNGTIVLTRDDEDLDYKMNYHKLIGGQLFNPNNSTHLIGDIFRGVNNMVNLGRIKDMILNFVENDTDETDIAKWKMIEFIMLCTSLGSNSNTYRLDLRAGYALPFTYRNTSAVFDVYSFFYNITDLVSCYKRFEGLFKETDRQKYYAFLNRKTALWRELLFVANDQITIDDKKVYLRDYEETKAHLFASKYIPSYYTTNYDNQEDSEGMIIDKLSMSDLHEWLSWSCFRNIDVLMNFDIQMNYNVTNIRTKKYQEILKHYFASAFEFDIRMHNSEIKENEKYYRLNFNFVGVIYKLLLDNDVFEYVFSKLIISSSDNEFKNKIQELPDEEQDEIIEQSVEILSNEDKGETVKEITNAILGYATNCRKDTLIQRINEAENVTDDMKMSIIEAVNDFEIDRFSKTLVRDIIKDILFKQ